MSKSKKSSTFTKKAKAHLTTYSFNRSLVPYPESVSSRDKPPTTKPDMPLSTLDTSVLFKPLPEPSLDEQAQAYMDAYRKAERAVVNNFYTGGTAYKKGILDSIYKGFNPLNP